MQTNNLDWMGPYRKASTSSASVVEAKVVNVKHFSMPKIASKKPEVKTSHPSHIETAISKTKFGTGGLVKKKQEARTADLKVHRKTRRNQISMGNREIVALAFEMKTLINNGEKKDEKSKQKLGPVRLEKLYKWKEEKQAKEALLKSQAKPAFKVAAAPGSLPKPKPGWVPPKNAVSAVMDNRRITRAMNKAAEPPAKPNASASKSTGIVRSISANVRLATVHTAKSSVSATKPNTFERTKSADIHGTIAQMKQLTVKPRNQQTENAVAAVPTVAPTDVVEKPQQVQTTTAIHTEQGEIKNLTTSDDACVVKTEPPEQARKFKPKGMDDFYLKFTGLLSTTGTSLRDSAVRWTEIVEAEQGTDIPETIRGDILSTVGKANLLVNSKLPQFGELLFYYLCKEGNPKPILPCDLEGWWDVASISVEQVQEKFMNFQKLFESNWVSQEEKSKENTENVKKITNQSKPRINAPKKPVTSKFKEFKQRLADKRQLVDKIDVVNVLHSEVVHDSVSQTAEKNFDGGFFSIASPAQKSSTPTKSTINRDVVKVSTRSLRRGGQVSTNESSNTTPQKLFAVRLSAGRMYNIGKIFMHE